MQKSKNMLSAKIEKMSSAHNRKKNMHSAEKSKNMASAKYHRRTCPVQNIAEEHAQWKKSQNMPSAKKSQKNNMSSAKNRRRTSPVQKKSQKNKPSAKKNRRRTSPVQKKIAEEQAQCETKSKKNMLSAALSTTSPICIAPGLNLGVRFEKKRTKI
jgi:hypothetical protein